MGLGTGGDRAIVFIMRMRVVRFLGFFEWPGQCASMLIYTSFTSCPPCGSEFLLRGGDENQSKRFSQGGQEVKEVKLRSDGSNRKSGTFGCWRPGSLRTRGPQFFVLEIAAARGAQMTHSSPEACFFSSASSSCGLGRLPRKARGSDSTSLVM